MLENFTILSKGGIVLWEFCFETLTGYPHPINALITSVLLEDRWDQREQTHTAGSYKLKWRVDNKLDLVYIAVHQKVFPLLYVDALLDAVLDKFGSMFKARRNAGGEEAIDFDSHFKHIKDALERESENHRRGRVPRAHGGGKKAKSPSPPSDDSDDVEEPAESADGTSAEPSDMSVSEPSEVSGLSPGEVAEKKRLEKLAKLAARKKGGKKKDKKKDKQPSESPKNERANRKWGAGNRRLTKQDYESLDFSKQDENALDDIVHIETVAGGKELDDITSYAEDDAEESTGGIFGFFKGLTGGRVMTREDVSPCLEQFREHLATKNVASEIAQKLCDSVADSLEGKTLPTLSRINTIVKDALETALVRLLTPKRSVDILREVMAAKAEGRPYTIVFMGVNGVGKSTNLSKVCFWLRQNDISVMMAACDTFRSGAVEQLKTHARRLQVEVFDRGYGGDIANIARSATHKAAKDGTDVVLIDTAGRMQDNVPLMQSLAKLITTNQPDLVLFVGEALVGNDGVDQLVKFNQALIDYGSADNAREVDGIVLTKFDTIDDKVGAAISMVYSTGAPIVFVGTGQNYTDLKRMNVESVVQSLLA